MASDNAVFVGGGSARLRVVMGFVAMAWGRGWLAKAANQPGNTCAPWMQGRDVLMIAIEAFGTVRSVMVSAIE
jgi:hypothetical protein